MDGEHSRLLIKKQHISATLKESVRGREASKTTTDDDDLSHLL